jgi:hypothetical protein
MIGGRFFIDERGAFWKTNPAEEVQFIKWDTGRERLKKLIAINEQKKNTIDLSFNLEELLATMQKRKKVGKVRPSGRM